MSDRAGLKFTQTHEWIRVMGKEGIVGISDHAQKEISDVVFVELPSLGKSFKQKESCAVVESVKAAFDIYAPVSGKILEVNTKLGDHPELINKSPYQEGWLFKMEIAHPEEIDSLEDETGYSQHKAGTS